jgi:hypothetical protein
MYMNGKQWVGLDYNVASDYTEGSPEDHRSRLRQSIGIPNLLPGETNANSTPERNRQAIVGQFLAKRNLSGFVHKGKRRIK